MKIFNISVRSIFMLSLIFALSAGLALAQTGGNKEDLKKLKDIKGDVKKITITTTEGTTTFEGSQAEWLMQLLKNNSEKKRIKIMIDSDEFEGLDDAFDFDFDFEHHGKDFVFKRFNADDSGKGMKKVLVTDENGEMKISVTTTGEDGNVKTEVYKGKEAEKYLQEHQTKMKKTQDIEAKDGIKKEKKKIIILERQ